MVCARELQRKLRKERPYKTLVPTSNPCAKCGSTEKYKKGDCKPCMKKRVQVRYRLRRYGVTEEAFEKMLQSYEKPMNKLRTDFLDATSSDLSEEKRARKKYEQDQRIRAAFEKSLVDDAELLARLAK